MAFYMYVKTDNSHEMSSLIFFEKCIKDIKMFSATVVISALKVKSCR